MLGDVENSANGSANNSPDDGISADIGRAVEALDRLEALGWDWPSIARAIDVRAIVVWHVALERIYRRRSDQLDGQPWTHDATATASLAGKLTALAAVSPRHPTAPPMCQPGETWADATRQQLERLRRGGWSAPAVARSSGVPLRTLQNVSAGQQTTSSALAEQLRALPARPPN